MFALDELDCGKELLFNATGWPTPSPRRLGEDSKKFTFSKLRYKSSVRTLLTLKIL